MKRSVFLSKQSHLHHIYHMFTSFEAKLTFKSFRWSLDLQFRGRPGYVYSQKGLRIGGWGFSKPAIYRFTAIELQHVACGALVTTRHLSKLSKTHSHSTFHIHNRTYPCLWMHLLCTQAAIRPTGTTTTTTNRRHLDKRTSWEFQYLFAVVNAMTIEGKHGHAFTYISHT